MAVVEDDAANAALEQLKPLLRPDKINEAGTVLTRFQMRVVSKSHSGPIPSAEELEHLERINPGMANRCMEMAEREQSHRHQMDATLLKSEFSLRGRGQTFGLMGLALLLIVTAFLAYLGFGTEAATLGSATIIGVVGIFVTGRYFDEKPEKPGAQPEPVAPSKGGKSVQQTNQRRKN